MLPASSARFTVSVAAVVCGWFRLFQWGVKWCSKRFFVVLFCFSLSAVVLPYLLREQACVLVAVKLPLDAVGKPVKFTR